MGLRVAKFRRLWNVDEQFLLTATVQNIKMMVKLLHRGNKEARKAIQRVANFSNLTEGLLFLTITQHSFAISITQKTKISDFTNLSGNT